MRAIRIKYFAFRRGKYTTILFLLIFLFTLTATPFISTSLGVSSSAESAYLHLNEVMDKFHNSFDVYTDLNAAGNHFIYLARMVGEGDPEAVEINLASSVAPYSGATSIKCSFKAQRLSWGGWYFLNGVLEGEETAPKANWGDYPNAGFDLRGATKLTFWARGERGGERVEFFVGGVGWKTDNLGRSLYPEKPYADSLPKVSTGYITLSSQWQKYVINLQGYDLSYVIGGFGWVTSASQNNNQDIVFYLDDIQYDKVRLNEPRFLLSFETIPSHHDFDRVMKNVAFVYDNALALLAYVARGNSDDWERAKLLADALVYAQNHDRYFTDGRLRNAYQAGDLILFPGWKPHGKEDTARIPGWWDEQEKKWFEDKFQVGTHTGNLAWAMIALLTYYENKGGQEYLQAVEKMGEWVERNTRDNRGAGGYTGGYEGWEQTANNPAGQTKLLWKSTEHNLDLYVAFTCLYQLTGDSKWRERADHAKRFVEAMWNPGTKHFWTGTLEDGITINTKTIPLDAQTWAVLAFPEREEYRWAINWAEQSLAASFEFGSFKFEGFDFNNDRDMPWPEGTAQMVLAFRKIGELGKAQYYLAELEELQRLAPNANGEGIVAAPADGLTTGFDWLYYNRLHIGATAWFIFAERNVNPLWTIYPSTTYEEPAAWYEGAWVDASHPLASGGELKLAPLAGSQAFFDFSGSEVKIISTKGPILGSFDVYIDGIYRGSVDLYDPSYLFKQTVASYTGLSPGTHTLRIVSTSGLVVIDAFVVAGTATSPTHYPDSAATYAGSWTDSSHPLFTEGNLKMNPGIAGDKATFTFTGEKVRIIGLKGPFFGKAEIKIDGSLYSTVDFYQPDFKIQTTIETISGLSPGTHIVEIMATGTQNPSSVASYINIDGFDVW